MFFNFAQFDSKILLILKIRYLSDIIPNHVILVSLDSLFHQLSVDTNIDQNLNPCIGMKFVKFVEFQFHLTPQFNV